MGDNGRGVGVHEMEGIEWYFIEEYLHHIMLCHGVSCHTAGRTED